MTEEMTKSLFLDTLARDRAEWDALLTQVPKARMTEPGVAGEWSMKDIIAHVSWHEREMVGMLRAGALVGSELWELPLHERNQALYEQLRARPLDEVLAEVQPSFQQLWEALQATSEEALLDPSHFQGMPAEWVPWQVIASNCYEHYRDHMPAIRAWLAQVKEEER